MSTESSANDESECVSPHDLSMASSESSSQHQEDRGRAVEKELCCSWQQDQQRREKKGKRKEEYNDISLWRECEVQWLEEIRNSQEIRVPPEVVDDLVQKLILDPVKTKYFGILHFTIKPVSLWFFSRVLQKLRPKT